MTRGRTRRRRPIAEFASRSPVHALAAWILRAVLLGLLTLAVYLLVVNVAVPILIDGFRP